jgi:hypothetical protein
MNIISRSCLLQYGYSFKSENNGCSIYMNNIFYGHAPVGNGSKAMKHTSITLRLKDAKLIVIIQLICGTAV